MLLGRIEVLQAGSHGDSAWDQVISSPAAQSPKFKSLQILPWRCAGSLGETRSEFRALASVSQEARVLLNKDAAMVGFFLRAPP